jgi:hypothetical protein
MILRGKKGYPLSVWEDPLPNCQYSAGIDPGEGLLQDYSVCDIYKKQTGFQVAQYVTRDEDMVEFAENCVELCRWYNLAIAVIERNRGELVIDTFLRDKYPKSRIWKDKNLVRVERPERTTFGWLTTRNNRERLIFDLKHAIKKGYVKIRSDFTQKHIMSFVKEKNRLEHAAGEHDDAVFAAALSWQAFKEIKLQEEKVVEKSHDYLTMGEFNDIVRGKHRGEIKDLIIGQRFLPEDYTFVIPESNFAKMTK